MAALTGQPMKTLRHKDREMSDEKEATAEVKKQHLEEKKRIRQRAKTTSTRAERAGRAGSQARGGAGTKAGSLGVTGGSRGHLPTRRAGLRAGERREASLPVGEAIARNGQTALVRGSDARR
jgi:hypothetical protein